MKHSVKRKGSYCGCAEGLQLTVGQRNMLCGFVESASGWDKDRSQSFLDVLLSKVAQFDSANKGRAA